MLGRQSVPWVGEKPARPVERGAYGLIGPDPESAAPEVLIIGTGAEVTICVAAVGQLAARGIEARAVSFPCWELFSHQPKSYRDEVLPPSVRARVAVEAGSPLGWERWVGDHGRVVGVDGFGASGAGEDLLERVGLTVAGVVLAAERSLDSARRADATPES